jgi:hypothetical protein
MAVVSRATLKSYFETNDTPTQAQFVDLIDSCFNLNDDNSDNVSNTGTLNRMITPEKLSDLNKLLINETIQIEANPTAEIVLANGATYEIDPQQNSLNILFKSDSGTFKGYLIVWEREAMSVTFTAEALTIYTAEINFGTAVGKASILEVICDGVANIYIRSIATGLTVQGE